MPVIAETELKKQIEKSEFVRLYFLYGEEKYLVEYYAQKLIAKAGGKLFLDFNLQKFDGGEVDVEQIASGAEALPFMAERKCVAVSDLDADSMRAGEAEKWKELLASLPESTVLVIYLPTLEIDTRKSKNWKKLLPEMEKAGAVVEFKRRTTAQLEKLLSAAAAKRGCNLSRPNADRLIAFSGTDLTALLNELEKLCAYVKTGEITEQAIDAVATKNLEARVYDLSKAILAGNYDKAYSVLDQLFSQNEEPVSVLAVLSSAYLDLYRVRVCLQSGYSAGEAAKHFDYARKEFRLTNAERDSKRFSPEMLRESLRALLAADTALKGARGDRRIVLEKLIAQLLLIAEKGKSID